ncbi:MAG: preprotein translocase subunit SecE [Labilithrix sp.]|nr:preprotein translocase subunit SecE [Labilithrix sp.]
MSTKEDLEKAQDESAGDAEEAEAAEPRDEEPSASEEKREKAEVRDEPEARAKSEGEKEAEESAAADEIAAQESAPMQFGYMRFVYGAYMAGAMLVAFLVAKLGHLAWYRLGQWKPEFGEPQDEIVYTVAGVAGALTSFYYWRKPEARQYATEVAEELSKVTWPSRKEVTNSTTVVIFYTLFATVFFALMDQFWKYITDHIYSF